MPCRPQGTWVLSDDGGELTDGGARLLSRFGVSPVPQTKNRRIFCRPCLDWSERRYHLAGFVGAEICRCCLERRWLTHMRDTRALQLTPEGRKGLAEIFGVQLIADQGRRVLRRA
jgi:hypothetical protein